MKEGKSVHSKPPGIFIFLILLLTTVLLGSTWVSSAVAADECVCFPCHGNFENVHENFNHNVAAISGTVTLFPDNGHDDAGWIGSQPFFAVTVDCNLCHTNDLRAIHGNDCATCHPSPYDTLGMWNQGCNQCHPFYHQDAFKAHLPFDNPYDPDNDCSRCHDSATWVVSQLKCLNCHASYGNGDVTPPVTTTDALAEYYGPAIIGFSVSDNGKVGVGRTFYQLDGGTVTAAGKNLTVSDPGTHELQFWSMDQSGNTEAAPNFVSFNIIEDNTPPVTTSDAKPAYSQGALITLSATDDSTQGVKQTYYQLNGGPIQAGTKITIPTTSGVINYTLTFWSEDWAGNIETEKNVSFTVTSGSGTIRLVWWDCDVTPSQAPTYPDKANWQIRKDSLYGQIVASGSGAAPNWDGIDDIVVQVGPQKYFVRVSWWDSYEGFYEITDFPSVYVTTPGEIVRLSY